MKLVLQTGYPTGCQQACLAMLAGRPLEDVIHIVGPQALGHWEFMKVCEQYKITMGEYIYCSYLGGTSLGGLVKKNKTYILSQSEAGNPSFGHAVLLHKGQLADPYHGLNPTYPWTRWFYSAKEVIDCPMIDTVFS